MSAAAPPFTENARLARLPQREIHKIQDDLVPVRFALGELVYDAHAPLHQVYFPVSAVLSIIKVMENGAPVETEARPRGNRWRSRWPAIACTTSSSGARSGFC